jgi:hypothetical protein
MAALTFAPRAGIIRALVTCLALLLLAPPTDGAQQTSGELGGRVRDDAGRAVPGATVTLTGSTGFAPRTTVTDAEGRYALRDLPPGPYQLAVALDGFATVTRRVVVNEESRQLTTVTLRVALDQRVEVVASLEDFRRVTGFSPAGLTLGPEHMGVLPNDPDMMLQVLRELSAATGRADTVTVYVDGQPIAARLPPKEAIQSIRISTNAFASEFAEPSSGLVEIITKPATTTFRGESQAAFNDSLLNARNFFEQSRRPTRTQGYTGYLGGPIAPGRWSFLAYGGHWQRDERVIVNTTTVDPLSLTPQPFLESIATPNSVSSYSLRSDVIAAANHLVAVEYARTNELSRNAGLESGLDLPERGINRDLTDETARAAVVSTFGPFVSSEFRVRLRRSALHEAALTTAPAVLVLDAFNAGGNQAALRQDRTTREATLSQVVSFADDLQAIRGGIQIDLLRINEQRRVNHGGTFVFGGVVDPQGLVVATPFERYLRTLQGVPGYGASYFSVARGAPSVDFDDWQVSWFLQDDLKHTDNVTLSAGVRHGLQQHARRLWQDIAPRAGIGWTPGGSVRHVVRFATGVFYSRLPPEITLDPLRYDGLGVEELVVDQPDFFPIVPDELTGTLARPTVRLKDRVRAPLTASATSSYEWQVSKAISATVGYTYSRGYRLLRMRNINAPDPASGLAPRPDRGPMLQFESTGRSEAKELRVTVRRALTRVNLFGTYLWRTALSETDGPYTVIADTSAGARELGRSADDERHRVMVGSWISLPREISISTLLTIGSGRPFNITTGFDNDGDLLFLDRPAFAEPGAPGAVSNAFGDFDLQLDPGQPMIVRNAGEGPKQIVLNVGIAKVLRLAAPSRTAGGFAPYAILGVNAGNVTNRVNFSDFNGVVTSPLFGAPNRALNPRRVELTLRFGF